MSQFTICGHFLVVVCNCQSRSSENKSICYISVKSMTFNPHNHSHIQSHEQLLSLSSRSFNFLFARQISVSSAEIASDLSLGMNLSLSGNKSFLSLIGASQNV